MLPIAASTALSAASSLASILGGVTSSSVATPSTSGSAVSPSSSSSASSTSSATATTNGANVSEADFMQLLIAQLQNQDPLNPVDDADFAAQLAQFSSLQQLSEINTTLKNNASATGSSGGLDAVGFLGKQVQGKSSSIDVSQGTPTTLTYTLSGTADVHASIVDANGATVAADLDLGTQNAGTQTFDLSKIANAPKLADGTYTVALAAVDTSGAATAVTTATSGVVTGIDLTSNPPTLLVGSRRIALTDVTQVQAQSGS